MKKPFRLPILFISLALLTACQGSKEKKTTVEASDTTQQTEKVLKVLTPRAVEKSTKKLLVDAYLRDVLPESAYIYARIPNVWSLAGGAVGNVFDKALASKPYADAFASIKEGFAKEVTPEIPRNVRALSKLMLVHITSPIEAVVMTPVLAKDSPLPNVLLTASVDFKDIQNFKAFLNSLVAKVPEIKIDQDVQENGLAVLKIDRVKIQLKFDPAAKRLFVLGGMSLKKTSLVDSLKTLKANPTHAMKALEAGIDDSGQGLFAWIDPSKVLGLANAMGAQRQLAPLAMLGVNSIKNVAVGMGTSKGINHLKFVLDMPKTGFRAFIPTVQDSPDFRLAGETDFVVTFSLPSKEDFVSIESSIAGMSPPDKMQEYYDFKKLFAKEVGIEIEDIFDVFGQDISLVSDESGTYTALRLKDAKLFASTLDKLVEKYNLKHAVRTISGQEYHHLKIPSVDKMIADQKSKKLKINKSSEFLLFNRLLLVSSHLYWQQEGDYLIMGSVPQILMDRHYASPQIPVTEWFEKEQRTDPKGALLMASIRNKGVPASMYRARLAMLSYMGDVVNRPVDLFALPSVREANLPKKGAFGLKLTSSEDQLALEFTFESNPVEILFASNLGGAYAGVLASGVLAAVAIPAYDDYGIRAKVKIGMTDAYNISNRITLFNVETGHYPTTEEIEKLDLPNLNKKDYQISIDSESGNIIVRYLGTERLKGRTLTLVKPTDGETNWKCRSDIRRKYLPVSCR